MVGLGDLPGGAFDSRASAASADGAIVLGQGETANGNEVFLWTADHGLRSLQELLVNEFGLDLTGWQLEYPGGISPDGRYIVGSGTNPDGNVEAWIVTIPEPATFSLLALAGLLLNNRRRKRYVQAVRPAL
jgi:uncharacterized membrane protein